jgi:hypothetical protein
MELISLSGQEPSAKVEGGVAPQALNAVGNSDHTLVSPFPTRGISAENSRRLPPGVHKNR